MSRSVNYCSDILADISVITYCPDNMQICNAPPGYLPGTLAPTGPDFGQEYSKKIKRIFPPLMIILAIAAVFIYPIGLNIFVKDTDFNQSIWIFGILMIGVTLNAFYRPFLGILLQGDRPGHHTLMVGILVVFNFIGNIILIPLLGIYGAAIATSFVYLLEGLLIRYFSKKLLGINL